MRHSFYVLKGRHAFHGYVHFIREHMRKYKNMQVAYKNIHTIYIQECESDIQKQKEHKNTSWEIIMILTLVSATLFWKRLT